MNAWFADKRDRTLFIESNDMWKRSISGAMSGNPSWNKIERKIRIILWLSKEKSQKKIIFGEIGNWDEKFFGIFFSVGTKRPQNQAFWGQGVCEISRPRYQISLRLDWYIFFFFLINLNVEKKTEFIFNHTSTLLMIYHDDRNKNPRKIKLKLIINIFGKKIFFYWKNSEKKKL